MRAISHPDQSARRPANRALVFALTLLLAMPIGLVLTPEAAAAGAAIVTEEDKLLPVLGQASAQLGLSVAIDGDRAVVGAPYHPDGGSSAGAAFVYVLNGTGEWELEARLVPNDGAAYDYFGFSVAISGNTALIGAYGDDDLGSTSGSAYVFTRSGTTWTQQAKLNSADGSSGDYFGISVALDGDTALIGAHMQTNPLSSISGAAYAFTRSGTAWSQEAKLKASDGASYDFFGRAVALDGDTALIGAFEDDDIGTSSGSAYVFTRSGTTWTQEGKLTAGDAAAYDYFGLSVALDGHTALVGAYGNDDLGTNSGSAYVFTRSGTTWTQQAKFLPSDGAANHQFGMSVSLSGEKALVGAHLDDDLGTYSGSAYVFTRSTLTKSWSQEAKLTADGGAAYDQFGRSVALSGARGLVGAPSQDHTSTNEGSAYVFEDPGSGWAQVSELIAGDGWSYDQFAKAVAIDGDTALIGAPGEDSAGVDSGAVYVFVRSGGSWIQQAKLQPILGTAGDDFGSFVALDGDTALIGAQGDDERATNSGATYVFTRSGTTWTQQAKLTADDGTGYDYFGNSGALEGDSALIGAYGDDENGYSSGSAYVFTRSGTTWTQQAKLTAGDGAEAGSFGISVALTADSAIIGAYGDDQLGYFAGSAYVFARSGTTWAQQAKLTADDGTAYDYFGRSVALDGDTALIGAYGDDDLGSSSGAVYTFARSGTTWTQETKLTANDGAGGDQFGRDVALDGDTALIGAYWDDDVALYAGSAYAFTRSGTSWAQQAKFIASDGAYTDSFGYAVALDGDAVLVGAAGDTAMGYSSGSAYVFRLTILPTAAFTFTPGLPTTQDAVVFTDTSIPGNAAIASWMWDFGDGTTSTLQHPTHTYAANGAYTVTLTVTDVNGGTANSTASLSVLNSAPTAAFSHTPSTPAAGTPVSFTDASSDPDGSIASWSWNLGDGTTSTAQNPSHTYSDDGTYAVTLTVTDDDGATATATFGITVVNAAPVAAFSSSPTDPGVGDVVQFTDASIDVDGTITAWSWDFGDGTTSTAQQPTHTYASIGHFSVSLTATDDDGSRDTVTKTVSTVNQGPLAAFSYSPTDPAAGETVTFTDASGDPDGTIVSWSWNLGDGTTSILQNASHTYGDFGAYDVTLTVTDSDGATSSTTKTILVQNKAPSAAFSYAPSAPAVGETVTFTDASTDLDTAIAAWSWNLGDGTTSTLQNPTHSYSDDGTYTVTLTVTDTEGATGSVSKDVVVANQSPAAAFSYSPADPGAGDPIQFTDASSDPDGSIVSWSWNLGDGTTSTLQNPSHSYAVDGTYQVTLTVTDDDGALATAMREILVDALLHNDAPVAGFSFSPEFPAVDADVSFTDASSDPDGSIASHLWDLGDGNTSTVASPTHAYANAGVYTVTLTVSDDVGAKASMTHQVRVRNTVPDAAFSYTPHSPSPGEAVQFKDGSTDTDGTIASWSWAFGDGTTSILASPSHSYAATGLYQVRLTVTDDDGGIASITHTVEVQNAGPLAAFSVSTVAPSPGDAVQFIDASSDGDGTIVAWSWDFGDGTSNTLASPTHTYATVGDYTVTLSVTDDQGATSTTTRDLQVRNQPPAAGFSLTPAAPSPGDAVQFTDVSTDNDGAIATWSWQFGDGTTSSLQHPGHVYTSAGDYTVTLMVTDDDGAKATTSRTIEVRNQAPLVGFSFSPAAPAPGETVRFFDISLDLDGTLSSYSWQLGDGTTSILQDPTHQYAASGTYTVRLTATDDDGASATATATLLVHNHGPSADISYTPGNPTTQTMVRFYDVSSDPDGTIVAWSWQFGDGATSTLQHPTHQYSDDGIYTVKLTVTDDGGAKATATRSLTVLNAGPDADFTYSPGSVDISTPVQFTDQSTDPDGSVAAWLWDFGDGYSSTKQHPQHQYRSCGQYQVKLTVTDDDGDTDTALAIVNVHLLLVNGAAVPCAPL